MTDREALTRAVAAHPDEDTPRLAFADWLDEHGDAGDKVHARFVRVQCEMAALEEQAPRWRKLFAEQSKLFKDLNRRKRLWPAHLKGRTFGGCGYERGFPAQITVFAKRFLAEAERFYADDPIQTVKFVKLTGRVGGVPTVELFQSPHLAGIRTLDLSGSNLGMVEVRHLYESWHLRGLKSLILCGNDLSPATLAAVILSPLLPSLAHLDLKKNPTLGDAEVRAMLALDGFRRIRSLDMFGSSLTAAGVKSISENPAAAGLEKLVIGSPDFAGVPRERGTESDAGHTAMAVAVASSPHLAGLKELDLSWRRIGLAGLEALADSPHLTNLRRLRLASCCLPLAALRVVAASPNFARLYSLELGLPRDGGRTVPIPPDAERKLRAALPDAAVRFE